MRWRRSCKALVGARMPVQTGVAWLSIVPIAESRSSYNGLLVFLFIAVSGTLAAFAIHRLASDTAAPRARPGIAAIPIASPATQYTADSFAQPIRRVFGTVVFRAREHVDMPPPGDTRPARLTVELRDLDLGCALCADRRRRRLSRPSGSIACSS